MPKFRGPSFGGGVKGNVDIDSPEPNLDIDRKGEIDVDAPKIKGSISKSDLDSSTGGYVKLPEEDVKSKHTRY